MWRESTYPLVEVLVRGSMTAEFGWLSSTITMGTASGSAAGGSLVDLGGNIVALSLAIGCASVTVVATLAASAR